MTNRTRRRKKQTYFQETMDIVKTILLVVIAAAAVLFVIFFIRNSLKTEGTKDMKISAFSALFGGGKEKESGKTETESGEETKKGQEIESGTEMPSDGLFKDPDGNLSLLENGVPVSDTWADFNGKLYYFDEIGLAVTDSMSFEAFDFSFAGDGSVQSIRYRDGYEEPATDYREDYPGLVQTKTIMVYLKKGHDFGRFSQIFYKKTAETMSHALGGGSSPQFTVPGTIQIGNGYIYWLPKISDPDELEQMIEGNLYRMKPGEETRELVAKNVSGYKVLSDKAGKTVIWYCQDGRMYRCGDEACVPDESAMVFTEDMEYETRLQNGRLYLYTKSGYPVTSGSDSFNACGFTYTLSGDGEIVTAASQTAAAAKGYTYRVKTQDVFGSKRSVITRTGADGTEEIISGEFAGEGSNIYYNPADGYLYIEYTYSNGLPYVVSSSLDGYVDMLIEGDRNAASMKILGFSDGKVYVKETYSGGTSVCEALDVYALTGLALGIDPVSAQSVTEPVTQAPSGPGSVLSGPGVSPGTSPQQETAVPLGPGSAPGGPGSVTAAPNGIGVAP